MSYTYHLLLLALLAIVLLTSCRDDFNINAVKSEPKLVLYCMPTVGDTTNILLSRSLPVNHQGQVISIDGARISYTVNGRPATVIAEGNGLYKAVARQTVGDRIHIEAEADGLPAVSAQTTILAPVSISDISTKEVSIYSDDYEGAEDYLQLQIPFTDPAETKDYYAVQVVSGTITHKIYTEDSSGVSTLVYTNEIDTIESVKRIYLDSEPLISGLSSVDYDFGYDDNDYEHFYVFTDDDINGKTYTLHLNVWHDADNEHYNISDDVLGLKKISPYYRVILYHITPEFYHFIHSIGSLDNNDLAKAGLSNIAPSFGNVKGGIGMVAGYHMAKTKWFRFEKKI